MLYVFTLTWNACDKLTLLKTSLIPALEGLNYLWAIKDNASKDDTVQVASTWGDKVKVFPYRNNLQNFSAGMNYLFKETKPEDEDYILLLNNDVMVKDKNSIKNMINLMENDDSVGVVGARLFYTTTDILQHAGVVFDSQYKMPFHFRTGQKNCPEAEKNRLFQVVTGAVLLTKAKYFKNVFTNKAGTQGMDENYHWSFDDVDLCLSIMYNMGKKIVYCGETNFFHEESASLKKNPTNKLFMAHNVVYLKNKWQSKYLLDQDTYKADSRHNLYRKKE